MPTISTFTAIDFETAHGARNSICQVGLVHIQNGNIVHQADILVQPPGNFYWDRFIEIHGITPAHTSTAPTFEKVWRQIQPYIQGQHVVAHNGFSFDFPVLDKTLQHYGLSVPDYQKHCTYRIYREALKPLCMQYGIKLQHHNALSDALACARLFMLHQKAA
jgi:DNA polymerase-3 subunit epsilon